jgi:hypothetical protein
MADSITNFLYTHSTYAVYPHKRVEYQERVIEYSDGKQVTRTSTITTYDYDAGQDRVTVQQGARVGTHIDAIV